MDCPLCGDTISDNSPHNRVMLGIEDMTRSAKTISNEGIAVEKQFVNEIICSSCWDSLKEDLTD